MDINKNIKIGARNLDDEELKILLPEWENIFVEINKIREVANSNKMKKDSKYKTIFEEEPEFTKYHNNVFSILGERGAGKTSVQLSLKYKLMKKLLKEENIKSTEEYKNDTVLPLIVPQDMEEDSSAIGWIIAYFSNLVEKIEDDFKENRQLFYYKNCKTNPVLTKFKELKKSFFIRSESYKNSINSDNSITEYIEKNGEVIKEDINLSKKFKEFVDEYIEYKKNINKNNASEPLIHIFFDDVDISNKKCLMVLETIMRYLSHANIVVFVAGDYSTFKETITLKYLKDDGLLYKDLLNETFEKWTALEVRQTLAYDYLKKVLSPALRYELKKYNLEEKKNFKYGKESETLNKILEKIVKNPEIYYSLFDDKPRGLINVYYFLSRISKEEVNINSEKFISIILDSSSNLNIEKERIFKILNDLSMNNLINNLDKLKNINLRFQIYLLYRLMKELKKEESLEEELENNFFTNCLYEKVNIINIKRKDFFDIFFFTEDNNIKVYINLLNELSENFINKNEFYRVYLKVLKKIFGTEEKLAGYLNEQFYFNRGKITNLFKIIIRESRCDSNKRTVVIKKTKKVLEKIYMLDEFKEVIDSENYNKYIDYEHLIDNIILQTEKKKNIYTKIDFIQRTLEEILKVLNLIKMHHEKKSLDDILKILRKEYKENISEDDINLERIIWYMDGKRLEEEIDVLKQMKYIFFNKEMYFVKNKIEGIYFKLQEMTEKNIGIDLSELLGEIGLLLDCILLGDILEVNLNEVVEKPISFLYEMFLNKYRESIKSKVIEGVKKEKILDYLINEFILFEEKLLECNYLKQIEEDKIINILKNNYSEEFNEYITNDNIVNTRKVLKFLRENEGELEEELEENLNEFLDVYTRREKIRKNRTYLIMLRNKEKNIIIAYIELLKILLHSQNETSLLKENKADYDIKNFREYLKPELKRAFIKELNK